KELMAAVEPSLDDANGRVRMAAALSLRRMAVSESFTPLWARLTTTAAQDREAVAVALGGPLKSLLELPVMIQAAKLKDLSQLISSSRGAVRDALIESASFLPEQSLPQFFAALLTRSADSALSAKVAEALAGRPQARAMLRNLSASPDARVRANAVWALGGDGDPSEAKFLQNAVSDADPAVAANAVAALALTVPASSELGNLLCRALSDARSYVRVNALVGLRHSQLRCSAGRESALLLRDPSPAVRKVAAELLHSVTGSNPVDDGRALARCRRHEVDVDVAQACQQRPGQAPPRGDRSSEPNSAVTVFVVPAGLTAPVANAPFAFVRADGFVRCGWTDSRGAVFEPSTPAGRVSLTEPPQALERN
ncbi:MAG TPA: HEAT repeat domain-containing protein, partial [Polyangiaceae bacterium]|nr:HEAT repeat domain-containing protein [Polyangiaceae bacterium]